MWISRIELNNFKSYQYQVFDFPQPNAGKNITLIGGMNGYGKTTILEAVYLGLFGKDAIHHLGRAGLKGDVGYRTFLERALHGHALRTSRETMNVVVQVNTTANEGFQIIRKWFFSRAGDWTDEEVLIYEVRNGIKDKAIEADHIEELLDQRFIPAHIAPFFFFDGEEVKKLADHSRVEQIKQGIEGLLGVVLLRKLETRLQQYQANRSQGVAAVDEQKHRELLDTLTAHEEEYSKQEQRKQELDRELDIFKTQRTELMNRIMAMGGGGGDVANARDIVTQQTMAEQGLKEVHDQLESVLSGKLPFHLVAPELMQKFTKQLREEIERQKWDARKSSLEPEKHKFLSRFFDTPEPPINPALSESQEGALRSRLEAAWESLFYPPPAGCADIVVHSYLSVEKRQAALQTVERLRVGAQDILGLMTKRDELQRKIRDLKNRYARIEGVDRDGTLAKLNAQLVTVSNTLDQKMKESGDAERQLTALSANINQERAVYQREHEKFLNANPVKSVVAKAQRVVNLIHDLIPQLYSLKIKHLGEAMTEVYKRLAHKKHVDKIDIDENGTARVLSHEGDEIVFDKSAGENQVFATALLAGLAKISGLEAPLIVDTPLGRLDSSHRNNILKYWVSDKNRQVILLSQDKEIDRATYGSMQGAVAKTYLLQHQEIGNGVGKTIAVENAYFQEIPA